MAISLLIFVPVFLYALFLDDLLRYSLDAQETALSTVWDFTVQDYAGQFNSEPVQHQARLMFCDHESGLDSYQREGFSDGQGGTKQDYPDCEGTDHHKALAAHVCWVNPAAEQVTCGQPEKGVASLEDPLHRSYQEQFNHGGLVRCGARAVVENYLLPKKFLQEFSKKELTKHQWQGAGQQIHDNAGAGTDDNAYFLERQQLAILTDTWALTRPADIRPGASPSRGGQERDLHAQVAHVYKQRPPYQELRAQTAGFFARASGREVLRPGLPSGGDDPREPNLAIAPLTDADPTETIKQDSSTASYFNTEWRDWDKDYTPETHSRRKAGYLGCRTGEGC